MSLILSLYLNNAIVMAADSRTTYDKGGFSDNRNKLFVSESNVGISTCGNATINGKPIALAIKSFLLENKNSSVTEIANNILPYLKAQQNDLDSIFLIAGYEKNDEGNLVQKKYRVTSKDDSVEECNYSTGSQWNGETDVLCRLIKDTYFVDSDGNYVMYNFNCLDYDGFSIQDGIDFCRFAFETTKGMLHFMNNKPTVGGNIDILVIMDNGHQWISKKELH